MGDFSRDTFDRMKHYVGVRLQQGVPIVDADWNELEDIRKYELQAFLKWFVGDGVPSGNDGFRIAPLDGDGVGTVTLTSRAVVPGPSALEIDIGGSTAAAALGFSTANAVADGRGSRPAQLVGAAAPPFALAAGQTLVVGADGQPPETVTLQAALFANIAAATAAEVVAALNAGLGRVVAAAGTGNDFAIMGGDGTPEGAGRCLVDGRDAILEGRLSYRTQPLFDNAALAAEWGVPMLDPLAAPPPLGSRRDDLVHLDVWEREVTSAEDDALLNPVIGVESCVRVRREWAVRVRPGATAVPRPGDPDFRRGHAYLPLARLTRFAGTPAIGAGTLTDLRARRLLVPPSTLIEDVLGVSAEAYRRGENRPLTNLREAINALLRGELPSTADVPVAPAAALDFMSSAFGVVGDEVVAAWHSRRGGGINQVFLARWSATEPASAESALPVQITPGPAAHAFPCSVLLPTGELVLVYETGGQDIVARRGAPSQLATAAEIQVAVGAGTDRQPFAVLAGELVVFFWQNVAGTARTWLFRRWRTTDRTFVDAAPQQLSTATAAALSGSTGDLTATVDATGDVWAAFRSDEGGGNTAIRLVRLRPAVLQLEEQVISAGQANQTPWVLADGKEAVWVFWRSGPDTAATVSFQRIPLPAAATWGAQPPPVAVAGSGVARPSAVLDAEGAVWLFWSQPAGSGSTRVISLQRFLRSTDSFGAARQITGSAALDDQPFPVLGPQGAVLLFWLSSRTGNLDIFSKQFITAL